MCARPANPELRSEILKAATRIVEGCGPDCVTMREVAQEVGYSSTTLYNHFKDKDDILREVMLEGFDALTDFCLSARVGPSNVDKLRQSARAYVTWGVLHPSLYQLMLESRLDVVWTPEEVDRLTRLFPETARDIGAAISAGEMKRVDDTSRVTTAMRATMHGVTSLTISRRLRVELMGLGTAELLAVATSLGDELMQDVLAPLLV